eukprot:GHRR01008342.1.p1 GENE.GHRR01008342.1~~GHRR01008342.1.p1  ORF type:complete len:233 (+),score=65.45 GHRR01008342.1:339-1037(+)
METAGLLRLQQYYTPYEVSKHNTATDCWVSFLGGVYDVTPLIEKHAGFLTEPILAAAGTDISHWFDAATGEARTQIDPNTQLPLPYCPQGKFLHIAPVAPTTSYDCSVQVPWWKDVTLKVGLLSSKTRLVRIKNVLTEQEDTLEVPSEETVGQIRQRYLHLNSHAASYTWKALVKSGPGSSSQFVFKELDLNRTLQENGVLDDTEVFESLDMPHDFHIPVLHVYWNDDLTVA